MAQFVLKKEICIQFVQKTKNLFRKFDQKIQKMFKKIFKDLLQIAQFV